MRTLSSLFLILFLIPSLASAATMPSEIIGRINDAPSTFAITAHVKQDDTYVSVWAKGQSVDPEHVTMNTTVDIAQKEAKMRIKGDLIMVPEGLFLRIREMSGDMNSESLALSMSAHTKGWVQIGDSALMSFFGIDPSTEFSATEANDIFTMQTVPSATGTTYVLQLKPDAASEMARMILDLFGGDRPVIQDFFPWRALAESMNFQLTVQTKADDTFVSYALAMDVRGEKSFLDLRVTEQARASASNITAPADFFSLEELMGSMMPAESDMPMMEELDTWEGTEVPDFTDASFEDVDTENVVLSVTCSPMDAPSFVGLMRSGECPVERVSRRLLR